MTTPPTRAPVRILVPTSFGELLDKITILEIKAGLITTPARRAHAAHELALLRAVLADLPIPRETLVASLLAELARVNRQLWDIEDAIRDCERQQDFGPRFVALARAVYLTNDVRAGLKRDLNAAFGSDLVEVKSHDPD